MALRTKTGLTSLPIWRDANQFLLAIEKVVKLFPKYHKYTLGMELRQNALKVCNLIHQAWQERSKQCDCLQQLKYCIDEIKIQLHLAKKLQALPSFTTFEWLAKQAVQLGKQNGGWYRANCVKNGQNST